MTPWAGFIRDNLLILGEGIACVALAIVALSWKGATAGVWPRMEAGLKRIAHRPGVSLALCFLLPVMARTALLPVWPVRIPWIHDEFSNLLLADTLAHGRLSNPTPPEWIHFETFHVIQTPTYSSIRPPAPALPLALAQAVTGIPWLGVLFGVGAMCAAIGWMLRQYVSPAWALMGGLLAGVHYGIASAWMNSYWGGSVAATAGAVMLGELERFRKRRSALDAVAMGLSAGLLVNTRPFEGTLFCGAVFAVAMFRARKTLLERATVTRQLLPLGVVLAGFAGWMMYYNHQTTGSWRLSAYVAGYQTYTEAPALLWQAPRQVHYNHPVMAALYAGWEMDHYRQWLSWGGALKETASKLLTFWAFFLRPALTIPAAVFLWRNRRRPKHGLTLVAAVAVLGMLVETWFNPHYIAHITGLVVLVAILGLQELRRMGSAGLFLSRALPCLAAVTIAVVVSPCFFSMRFGGQRQAGWYLTDAGLPERARVVEGLKRQTGTHLVFVRYAPNHFYHVEWVWNEADLYGARIVWARDLGPESDARVARDFPGRSVWLVEPDTAAPAARPYQPEQD